MADISVANTTSDLSGKTLITCEGDKTVTGLITFDRDPGAPFAVSGSSAKVTNLDADKLDGVEGAGYLLTTALTWAAPTFSAGDFTATDGGTWVVESGDVTTLAYIQTGKTMTVAWNIHDTTITGSPTSLLIKIPNSGIANRQISAPFRYSITGTNAIGFAYVSNTVDKIYLAKIDGTAWSGTILVQGQLTFEIQ